MAATETRSNLKTAITLDLLTLERRFWALWIGIRTKNINNVLNYTFMVVGSDNLIKFTFVTFQNSCPTVIFGKIVLGILFSDIYCTYNTFTLSIHLL